MGGWVGGSYVYLLPYTVRKVRLGEEEEEEEGRMVKLVHCLENSRALHMMGAGEEEERRRRKRKRRWIVVMR